MKLIDVWRPIKQVLWEMRRSRRLVDLEESFLWRAGDEEIFGYNFFKGS